MIFVLIEGEKHSFFAHHNQYRRKCCELGFKLAKHGYMECTWSMKLIRDIHRIDDQWRSKSRITGASPASSLVSLRRLYKCKQHKAIFNKCCTTEKLANDNFLKLLLLRLRGVDGKIRKRSFIKRMEKKILKSWGEYFQRKVKKKICRKADYLLSSEY